MTARLFVVCGLPGSGKTTLAKQLEREHNAVRFCPDEWMLDPWNQAQRVQLHEKMWEVAQRLLEAGVDVVVEFGSWSRAERDEMRLRARELGCGVELRYLDVAFDELVRRVEARNGENGNAVITRAHLDEWRHLIEVPTEDELALFDTPAE